MLNIQGHLIGMPSGNVPIQPVALLLYTDAHSPALLFSLFPFLSNSIVFSTAGVGGKKEAEIWGRSQSGFCSIVSLTSGLHYLVGLYYCWLEVFLAGHYRT